MSELSSGTRRAVSAFAVLATTVALGGCAATQSALPPADADTMTMAEMRLDEAGGPARAAVPASLVSPVAAPAAPGPGALTDAGANTALGKQWVFTMVDGFDGTLPPAPKNASILMSRESGRVVGSTSCNPLTASFRIDPVQATLTFKNIATGRAMCGEPNVDVEDAVVDAMNRCDSFLLDGRKLSLIAKGVTIAELVTP